MRALPLQVRAYGESASDTNPVVLLHGLFGSAMNWHGIARALAGRGHVLVPDLRNHGASPHADEMDYGAHAGDVAALLDRHAASRPVVVGHSMGGKVAMRLALEHADRIGGLVVVDIAPVAYPDHLRFVVDAMQRLDLPELSSRAEADAVLARSLREPALRQFLLQNLLRAERGFRWRINLPAIAAGLESLMDFPVGAEESYEGPVLFLSGARSDYLDDAGRERAMRLFPGARFEVVPEVGHWVHAEQPERFLAALQGFLG
jgi:pimeloyl-ACP methyl ester carboxylesterase